MHFNIIQGLETLPVRIKQHSKNALALATWLESQEEVAWVNYPGLESSKYKSLADKYLPKRTKWNCYFWRKRWL